MSIKITANLTNTLLLMIILLLTFLSFLIYKSIDNKQRETHRIENLISTFEKKYNNNNSNTANNNISNNKLSQKIIDSIINEYEEKLKFAYANFKIFSENELNSTTKSKNRSQKKPIITDLTKNNYNNVTSYSKLKNYKSKNYKFKESKNTTNVTTYTKLKSSQENRNSNPNLTINKVKNSNTNNEIVYLNMALNTAKNINEVTSSPIFPGCENQATERSKKNCLATKMSTYLMNNFNTDSFNHKNLRKGINNIRVILIIDKNGYSESAKIIGNWHPTVKTEVNRVIKNLPRMKPGMNNSTKVPVKYSFKIPFIIN